MFFIVLLLITMVSCTKQAKVSFSKHGYSDTIISTLMDIPDTGQETLLIRVGNRPWDIAPAHFLSDTEYVADSEKIVVVKAKIVEKF